MIRSLILWSILGGLGLLLPLVANRCPDAVEQVYSKGLFIPVAAALGWLGRQAGFSLAQIIVGVLLIGLVVALGRLFLLASRRDRGGLLRWFRGAVVVLAFGIWSFEVSWGLQYARPTLASRLQLPDVEPNAQRLALLTRWLADETNRAYDLAVRTDEIEVPVATNEPSEDSESSAPRAAASRFLRSEDEMIAGLERAYRSIEPFVRDVGFSPPKRPEPAGWVLSRLGISGIYFPFTGEATVNALLPPVSFPFTAAHEMAHQRGIAREDEANLAAYLACREAGLWSTRYAGSLGAYLRVRRALWKAAPDSLQAIGPLLAGGPQADVESIRAFWARYEGPATTMAERVNDTYLKANQQTAGVASYDLMVRILVAFQEAGMLGPGPTPAIQ